MPVPLTEAALPPPHGRRLLMRMVIATGAVLLLCGFRPVTPTVTYTHLPFSKVIGVYRDAYAHAGMRHMTVTTESRQRYADGSTDFIGTYGFSYPASAAKHAKSGGIVFSVRALLKHGTCIECSFSCRFYTADPAADGKATVEIKRRLGQSLPAVFGGTSAPDAVHAPPRTS